MKGIVANAIDVVVETGDSGPVTPVGINLPNDQKIREEFGSKSVSLSNVNEAYDKSSPDSMRSEFSWTPEEAERSAKFGTFSGELHTDMHEVIGHASGQQAPGFKGTPQAAVKEHFSALEEGRADLIALYFIADPKLAELGVVPAADQEAIARTEYEAYTRNAIVQLRRVREGTQIEEDHMRNRQMVVRWLMANTKAIVVRERDNKTFYEMVDAKAFRDGVGRLLAEVQRIKSEGDYAAAAKLFDDHGIHFDSKLRDQVVARVDALKLPSYTGFVMPKLTAARDAAGAITSVTISYPQDLTTQMLEYSGRPEVARAPQSPVFGLRSSVPQCGTAAVACLLACFCLLPSAFLAFLLLRPRPPRQPVCVLYRHRCNRAGGSKSEHGAVERQLGFQAADDAVRAAEAVLLPFERQIRHGLALLAQRVGHHLRLIGRHDLVLESLKQDERTRQPIDGVNRRARACTPRASRDTGPPGCRGTALRTCGSPRSALPGR